MKESITIKTRTLDGRMNFRTTAEKKALIARAAEKANQSISEFVLGNALAAAEAVMADDANFTLDKKNWKDLCDVLDAPPRKIPALRKLLIGPGVFDAK